MRVVLDAANEGLRLMLLFAATTGARAGEQWAARWRDVDIDERQLNIGRRVDAYGEEGAPKSGAGVRTVPLSNRLVAMLKAWKLKSKFKSPDDLIFPNREGNHTGHDNLIKRHFCHSLKSSKRPKRMIRRSPGAARRFNWHGLRHFACHVGLRPGLRRRRCRHSQAMLRCKSQWIAMGICSQARITRRQWTRSPKGCSHETLN